MRHWVVVFVAACSSPPKGTTDPGGSRANRPFAPVSARVLDHLFHMQPSQAVSLGLHDYDGELPDISPAGLDDKLRLLRADRKELEATEPATELEREERDTLILETRRMLFEDVELDAVHENPMHYVGDINLEAYVTREYAPAAQRGDAVTRLCKRVPAFLKQARANLKTPFPKPWLETAILQTKGRIEFTDGDARKALPMAGAGLDVCKAALAEHAAWLEQQLPSATQNYALGKERFLKMLSDTQGFDTDLDTLVKLANADLARNTKAIEEAAHAIDPKLPVATVVALVATDRPEPKDVLDEATKQAAAMRQFLIDHKIVTVPGDEVAEVRESPPFERWNAASLDGPGPFETTQMPSFYYISPPDPTWTPDVQRDYIPPRADLLFTTIHEVYPGHFIHSTHLTRNPSRVLRSLWSYATGEGWAHYTEEMMWEAGAAGTLPQAHIGQLKEALLRDVRFVVTLGEHTGNMTVDQAERWFETKAFLDKGNAHQQAVRGTFDPMYLAYTLGKLAIRKLRDDWMARHPGASLGEFHDAFLSHGAAPLPVIRRAMVGDAALL